MLDDVLHAVADMPHMYRVLGQLADQLHNDPGHFDRETSAEAGDLLRWLSDGNYLVLGHAAHSANDLASSRAEREVASSGVLRGRARVTARELLPAFRSGVPLVIFKSPLVSTVRRSAHYDCVTVITPATDGEPQLIHVFLGLITSAEDGTVGRVPVVRRRIGEIMARSGVRASSHTGRRLLAALRTLPRDELLEAPTADLARLAQLVADRAEHGDVGVFARIHLNRDFVTVLVYFPADRFGPETRRAVRKVISKYWPGEIIGRDDKIVEMNFARMQLLIAVRPGTQPPSPERREVEDEVAKVTRRWSDDLRDLLALVKGEEAAEQLLTTYSAALPEAYKEDFGAATAVRDLTRLADLPPDDGLAFDLYTPGAHESADRRLKVFRTGAAVSLARALPIFTQMGIEVLDERPYEIDLGAERTAWIYDFGLRLPAGVDFDDERARNVIDTVRLLWRGEIEQDGLNALVVRCPLTWWQVNILRAYAKYLRQVGTTFSQGYLEQALVDNPQISAAVVELFEARFEPDRGGEAPLVDGETSRVEHIEAQLADVASLDQDRILRSLLGLVNATLRTNAYRSDAPVGASAGQQDGERRTALAIKLDPRRIPDLPQPRPRYEIWVYSPRLEGVHLRFGPIARGGLRWSDRREDFRTEILGLVKAQTVKNAVIVPTGAKGGFVAKRLPDPNTDRDAWLAEGTACYRTFISCLLDVTDNYRTGDDGTQQVVPPPQIRRYDADDPYLVVAADKGTASFSDIANEISLAYGFWLGDAFASGGSVGYDHKAMGITARGAWESVKYHFRELGLDTQTQDFTVVGVGDMSGDVFGNGMLLSEHIKLVAAFDHRHVFLDPDPDPATSFAERRRLFELPRSSWADYDASLISAGGGVHPRTAKSIPVTEQVARALGLDPGVESLSPPELIHAILLAPVDLFWNGGIGTYVKASTETNADAGDKANDALRADADQLRCRVVGEGGNLGLTQRARVEFARRGGRINTDAIDNSAGVDTSDHEVNLEDPARPRRRSRRDRLRRAQRPARGGRRRRRGPCAARQLRAERAARHGAHAQPGAGRRAPTVHARPAGRGRAGPRAGVPARRRRDGPPRGRRPGVALAGELRAGGVLEEGGDAAHRGLHAARRAVLPAHPRRLLPEGDRRTVRRRPRQAPAPARDHHHVPGERHDQPFGHDVRAPRDRGDRRAHRAGGAGVQRGPHGIRAAGALGADRGAGQRGAHRGPARCVQGDPPAGRPRHPLAGRRALPDHRRRRRDRALSAHRA